MPNLPTKNLFKLTAKYIFILLLFIPMILGLSATGKPLGQVNHNLMADTVYNQVDQQPEFPGGMDAFYKLVGKIVRYPMVDMESGRQGTVVITCVIEPDGSMSNIKAIRGPSATLKQEALRVLTVLTATKWQPGLKDGQAVRVAYTLPIKFASQSYNVQTDENKVFTDPFRKVLFPGGEDALDKFISQNMHYPKDDLDKGVSGKVTLTFIVEKDGKLTHIAATDGPSDAMKAEAIRIMKLSPKWTPGMMDDGSIVRVSRTLLIEFQIPVQAKQ